MLRAASRLAATALAVGTLAGLAACTSESSVFDSDAWKAAEGCRNDNSRLRMVSGLQMDVLTPPPSEPVLIDQLGKPERRKGKVLSYCLGMDVVDYDFYVIILDDEGIVADHYREQG